MYKYPALWFIAAIVLFSFTMLEPSALSFKSEQKKHTRVKEAYLHKEDVLEKLFAQKGHDFTDFSMILAGYKTEKELCVYIKSKKQDKYTLLKTYDFCVLSGAIGPKRKEGDAQVPEGLYSISAFNPASNYHLSLRVNYPNASDRILSGKQKPGGDIYIHGDCVSIGCIPITNDLIEELYIMCVEVKNRNRDIPVYIFPCKMTATNMAVLQFEDVSKSTRNLWDDLKKAYARFSAKPGVLDYSINKSGRYILSE